MPRKLPPLNALRSFEAAGRHMSFTKAADELFVTETAVSKAVKHLEDHFGVKMFARTKSGLELTEFGTFILPKVGSALDELSDAAQNVYQARNKTITILSTPYFAAEFIAPLLKDLHLLEPGLNISIRTSFRYEQLGNAEFDIAIWYGSQMRAGFAKEPLCNLPRIPICSHDYAREHGLSKNTEALDAATLLHEFDYSDWEAWCKRGSSAQTNVARGIVTDQFETTLRAAQASAGIGLLFEHLIHDPSKNLVAPFGTEHVLDTDYWLFRREKQVEDGLTTTIIDFLKQKLKQ